MNTQIRRRIRLVAVTTALALTLVPVAGAGIDGRSPDTKDAAANVRSAPGTTADLRSPDTRDAGLAAHTVAATSPTDLRSPDTQDAALTAHSAGSTIVVESASGRFDWTDAGIGAAGGFAVALILGGLLVLARVGSGRKLAL